MSSELSLLSEKDFKASLEGRVVYGGPAPKAIVVRNSKLQFSVFFKDILAVNQSNIFIAELIFIDCTFSEEVSVGDYNHAGNIKFKKCIFENSVEIETYQNVRFSDNCIFKGNLSVTITGTGGPIRDISIEGVLYVRAYSIHSLFFKEINNGSPKAGDLVLEIQVDVVQVQKSSFNKVYFSDGSKIEERLHLQGLNVNLLMLDNLHSGDLLEISNSKISRLVAYSNNLIAEKLDFFDNSILSEMLLPLGTFSKIEVYRSDITSLQLSESFMKAKTAFFQKLRIEWLGLSDINNEGLISLREVDVGKDGLIEIRSSNLGKTDFILCNFKNANFKFINSKLAEIFVVETEFPKKVLSDGEINYRQAQLAFGQISTAFQKQGDTVRALEYQAREIEAHYKQLPIYNKEDKKLSFTKISLWLNKWSNDFGRSWQRGLLFSFIVGLIFFYFLIISTSQYKIGLALDFDQKLFISYFKFMNPLRFLELETIFKIERDKSYVTLTGYSYFWDFLGRVFVAYGFYQTIQAFRRYGRK